MKTKPFNLKSALAGAKLVTGDGRNATGFRKRGSEEKCSKSFPYAASVNGRVESFRESGEWGYSSDENDLFLVDEAPAPKPKKPRKVIRYTGSPDSIPSEWLRINHLHHTPGPGTAYKVTIEELPLPAAKKAKKTAKKK